MMYSSIEYALEADSGALKWKYETGGSVMSNPTPSSGINPTIYTGSYDQYIYALRALDGGIKWRTRLGGQVINYKKACVDK